MTTAYRGRDFALYIADPAVSPSVYALVAGLRTSGLTINNNPVDITNIGSEGYRELLADGGVQSFELSGDGIFDDSAPGVDTLATAAIGRQVVEAEIRSGNGDRFRGSLVVMTFQRNGAYDQAETFSVTLGSTGRMTLIRA